MSGKQFTASTIEAGVRKAKTSDWLPGVVRLYSKTKVLMFHLFYDASSMQARFW
jgi:hypothetical protein